jgi:2-aminoethylphosphonate-pyruvate transaminase
VYIEADAEYNLVKLSKNKNNLSHIYAEFTGISKFSKVVYEKICSQYEESRLLCDGKVEYEFGMCAAAKTEKIHVLKIQDYLWCEIDNMEHLKRAEEYIYPAIARREKIIL